MGALSTVGDVFTDEAFSAPGNSLLCGLGRRIVSALGSSSCRSDHMGGVWIHMAATSTTMQIWRLDPETPRLTSQFSSTSAPPTCLAPTAPRAVNKLNKDCWNVKLPGLSDGRGDVNERDDFYHDHVSAFLATPSTVTRLHSDNSLHSVLHHSATVRYQRLQSPPTSHFSTAYVSQMAAALADPFLTQQGL